MTPWRRTAELSSSEGAGIRRYLGLNLKMLSFIGMEFSLSKDRPVKKSRFAQTLPIFMTNALSLATAILEVAFIAFAARRLKNQRLVNQITSELLSNVLCISKSLSLAAAVESIGKLLYRLSILWTKHKPCDEHCESEIAEKARKSLNLSRCYLGVMVFGVLAFALPPIYNFAYHRLVDEAKNYSLAYSKRIFMLRYPFEMESWPVFLVILAEEWYLLVMSSMYWLTCDTLFAQLTTHTSLQLKILHWDVRALINHEIMEDRLRGKVITLVKRHQELLRVCRLIEDIFSPVILMTVLLSALNICVNLFEAKTMSAEGNHAGTALYTILVAILFFQILFYCSFAETLTDQTSSIAEAVYGCSWTEKSPRLRFYLQMIMMKSQSPFYCTAYGFFPIGHAKMAQIINTSFTYLMMLQSIS